MNKRTLVVIAAIAIVLLAILAAIFFFKDTSAPANPQPTTSSSPPIPTVVQTDTGQPVSSIPQGYAVLVYFSKHPDSDNDPTKTFSVDRTSPTAAIATYAIGQLIAGPTSDEAALGLYSTVRVRNDTSICNNKDFKITISNGTATLQFCRTFDAIGTMSDATAQETIKATLLQFSTIKKVIILSKTGNCQFDMSGQNLCLQ